jgi:hypothetical protein
LKTAYVDSSCLISIVFCEPGYRDVLLRLAKFERRFSSALLEAELRSAMAREQFWGKGGNVLAWLAWVNPRRRLTREMDEVLEVQTPRGPDLWHLANAIYLRKRVGDLTFLTLDRQQKDIAQALGFLDL